MQFQVQFNACMLQTCSDTSHVYKGFQDETAQTQLVHKKFPTQNSDQDA